MKSSLEGELYRWMVENNFPEPDGYWNLRKNPILKPLDK